MQNRYAKAIDQKATDLLRELDSLRVPVDVEAVVRKLGAEVVYGDLEDDMSGFLLRENGVMTIAVNRLHHPNRQRFTVAHECGHLYLHGDPGDRLWVDKATIFYRDASSSSGDKLAEIQANQFAAGLLMPELLLKEHLTEELSDVDIFRLALRFQVSEQAMTLR
ncbi:MAG: ImmA/IrrE family metallo-endopeptidase, partial [Candidatus Micrarchaeaceae archaeon]